ncbi:MAG: antibiotic biosynthesis monooxygenase family protein [Nitrososphaeraceae archaeon]
MIKLVKGIPEKLVEMDEQVTLVEQMNEDTGRPVILVNKFNVDPDEVDMFLKDWEKDATYFRRQPGCISAQLHQGIGGSGVFVNYAVWESTSLCKKAPSNIDIPDLLSSYPPSTVASPPVFRKVAV